MSKAAHSLCNTPRKIQPDDAELFAMIKRLPRLWRDIARVDKRETRLLRRLRSMVGNDDYPKYMVGLKKSHPTIAKCKPLVDEIQKLRALYDQMSHDACDLERRMARTKVSSVRGYEAKVRAINDAEFDDDVMVEIAWRLGREAALLGIAKPPKLEIALARRAPPGSAERIAAR